MAAPGLQLPAIENAFCVLQISGNTLTGNAIAGGVGSIGVDHSDGEMSFPFLGCSLHQFCLWFHSLCTLQQIAMILIIIIVLTE